MEGKTDFVNTEAEVKGQQVVLLCMCGGVCVCAKDFKYIGTVAQVNINIFYFYPLLTFIETLPH